MVNRKDKRQKDKSVIDNNTLEVHENYVLVRIKVWEHVSNDLPPYLYFVFSSLKRFVKRFNYNTINELLY